MTSIRNYLRAHMRDPNPIAYALMFLAAVFFPVIVQFATNGNGGGLWSTF